MRHPSWSLLLPVSLVVAPLTAQAPQAQLLQALQANRLPLTMGDGRPAGPGWDWLVQEARTARFTLIGEEHGVRETAQLAAALFTALRGSGYSRVAIELSPPIAQDVEAAARRNGRACGASRNFCRRPGYSRFPTCMRKRSSSRMSSRPRPGMSGCCGDSTVRSSAIAT